MSEELKGCPFCGSNAAVIYESGVKQDGSEYKAIWTVECASCGVGYKDLSLEYEEVIEHWNRRA